MRTIRWIPALLLCLLILIGCGAGERETAASVQTPAPTPAPTPEPVVFAAGAVPGDTRELTLILQPGETALLDSLPALESLDARGSDCYEELAAWGLAHPEVTLRYTVPVPGLGPVENTAESLDLTGLSREELPDAAADRPARRGGRACAGGGAGLRRRSARGGDRLPLHPLRAGR